MYNTHLHLPRCRRTKLQEADAWKASKRRCQTACTLEPATLRIYIEPETSPFVALESSMGSKFHRYEKVSELDINSIDGSPLG